LTPTEFVGMERNPNRSEKRVSAIPTQAMMPRTKRTGLMPKLGEAGPEERTICMPRFDYGTGEQAQQVFPGRARMFESLWTNRRKRLLDFNLNSGSRRKEESLK
jgi:hypothetical protein